MARSADWSLAQPPPRSGTVTPAALTHGNPRSLTGARLCVVAHVDDLRPEESTLHGLGIVVQGLAAEYAEVLVLAVAGDGDVAVDPALVLSHLTTPAEESVRLATQTLSRQLLSVLPIHLPAIGRMEAYDMTTSYACDWPSPCNGLTPYVRWASVRDDVGRHSSRLNLLELRLRLLPLPALLLRAYERAVRVDVLTHPLLELPPRVRCRRRFLR
jgi:hypothetical protein